MTASVCSAVLCGCYYVEARRVLNCCCANHFHCPCCDASPCLFVVLHRMPSVPRSPASPTAPCPFFAILLVRAVCCASDWLTCDYYDTAQKIAHVKRNHDMPPHRAVNKYHTGIERAVHMLHLQAGHFLSLHAYTLNVAGVQRKPITAHMTHVFLLT